MPNHKLTEIADQYSPPLVEENVLQSWKEGQTFQKSIDNRSADNSYSFYDGPPFITGLPHYGHLLGSIVKDVVPRFQTMKGKRVERTWGWDCHGLPAENKVEKLLGINSKKEIETLGIGKFIDECKSYVNNVSVEWEWYIDHIGRWVDFQHSYKTMDRNYMESVIWVFKQLYDKQLIYKGKRVSLFCPRCSTPISNFEVAQDNSYKDVTDPSVFAKFKLKSSDEYLLVWTTTPWTLPTNFAVALDEKSTYTKVKFEGEVLIVAKSRLSSVFEDKDFEEVADVLGSSLVGLEYEPLYSYYPEKSADYHIYSADFVSMEDGTGLVHIAPGFGEDDTKLGKEHDLSMVDSITEEGHLKIEVTVAEGRYFKAADKYILADLQSRNLIFMEGKITHSYPHCHRCETPLLYKAQEAWFMDVQSQKDELLKTNKDINWVPKYFKEGRFKLGIENAPDWCISRTRYWGCPVPVWECPCGQRFVPGSISELEELTGHKIEDLHRPVIDEVTIKCDKCGGTATRVKEVLDSWIEAASMPYAQRHYPFENKDSFKSNFPADFITEYTGQLRAWFYVMHVVSNALFNTHCFNNCVVTGVILGTDGRKMSKNYGNYPDPKSYIVKHGADSLRLYLMGSPIVSGQDILISETDWQQQNKTTLSLLWNSYRFFVNYASLENWQADLSAPTDTTVLDKWITIRLRETVTNIDKFLSAYELPKAVAEIQPFVNDLSTWYVRRSRDRIGSSAVNQDEKQAAYSTMHHVFKTFFQAIAPITPFISDYLYKHLTGEESVHLTNWPIVESLSGEEKTLLVQMEKVRKVCEMGNSERKRLAIPVKQPLASVTLTGDVSDIEANRQLIQLIKEELNIEDVKFTSGEELVVSLDTNLTPTLINKGQAREVIRSIQQGRKDAGCRLDEIVDVEITDYPEEFAEDIKRKALIRNLSKSSSLRIVRIN